MTATQGAIALSELLAERITDVQLNGCKAIETRMNPADYDEILSSRAPYLWGSSRAPYLWGLSSRAPYLWGLPLKADAKVPVGRPRILAKRR